MKLKLNSRKKLKDTTLTIDLTEAGFSKITYKPLSPAVINEYKRVLAEQEKLYTSKMSKKLKLGKMGLNNTADLQNKFLSKFKLEDLQEVQKEVTEEYNSVFEFAQSIDGMPTKEELIEVFEKDFDSEQSLLIYTEMCNNIFTDFTNIFNDFKSGETEETPSK